MFFINLTYIHEATKFKCTNCVFMSVMSTSLSVTSRELDNSIKSSCLNGRLSNLCMGLLIKWFRFNSYVVLSGTAFLWIIVCYQVLKRSGSFETNAFNLVDDMVIEEAKEVRPYFCFRVVFVSQKGRPENRSRVGTLITRF